MPVAAIPLTPAIGAHVTGVDASRPLAPADVTRIRELWAEHQVLLFRDQSLSDAKLVAFSRHFGELDGAPPNEAATTHDGSPIGFPEVTVISNVLVDGEPIGALGAGEAEWHTDMSYVPQPPSASLLYAIEVPATGGNTSFCNMYRAYEQLDPAVRARIDDRRAIHDATNTSAGGLRKGFHPVTDVREAPGARHPLVRIHPVTGRRALFLGRRRNAYIEGLSVAESEELLDLLWAQATRPQHAFSHQWQKGDLLLWDNRCAMHRRDAFDPHVRRVMHRTQVKGDAPHGLVSA